MQLEPEDQHKLAIAQARGSVGWEETSSELTDARRQSVEYFNGVMKDVPSAKGLSSQVSYDVADTIETMLCAIHEIYTAEDTVQFLPSNAQDIEGAQQETDFLRHVFFVQNNGFKILYDAFKDALLLKTGVFHWQWEPTPPKVEHYEGKSQQEYLAAMLHFGDAESMPGMPVMPKPAGTPKLDNVVANSDGTFDFDITTPKEGRVVVSVWPPEDLSVSDDGPHLHEQRYVGLKTRLSRGELLADGYDAEDVLKLPRYDSDQSLIMTARDTAGEQNHNHDTPERMADIVEIIYHYIRYSDADGETLYRVVTGGEDYSVLLKTEIEDCIPLSAICPFPVPHKFYGESIADKARPIQRVKTAIWRATLDQAYIARSGRIAVSEDGIGAKTLSDLMNARPGGVIRVKGVPGQVIQQVQSGQMGYEPYQVLEYASTELEQRTGVTRTSMGLSPDSLHERAGPALAMMGQGQLRTRFIAQQWAASGVKQMLLGVHKLIRENSTMSQIVRLSGKFVQVDPTTWGERLDMEINVGGSKGSIDHQIAALQQTLQLQQSAIQAQGGSPSGPLVNPPQLLAAAMKLVSLMGVKNPDAYFNDPASYQPPAPQPPKPDPALAKVQADAQASQAQLQLDAQKHADNHALATQRVQNDAQLRQMEIELRNQLDTLRMQSDAAQRAHQVEQELSLKQQEIEINARLLAVQTQLGDDNEKSRIALDAQAQATQHAHDLLDMSADHALAAHKATLPPVRPGGDASE